MYGKWRQGPGLRWIKVRRSMADGIGPRRGENAHSFGMGMSRASRHLRRDGRACLSRQIALAFASAVTSDVAKSAIVVCMLVVGVVVDEPDHSTTKSLASNSRVSTTTFCTV